MRRALPVLFVVAAVVACGGPLDRRDGALKLELSGVPDNADRFDVSIRAGGRDFAALIPRRPGDVIDDFSAIPAGEARISVYARAGTTRLASRLAVLATIVENETQTVPIDLASGPEVDVLSPVNNARLLLSAEPIAVVVRARDPDLPTDLSIRIGDRVLPVQSAGDTWSAFIDPQEEVPVPPASIVIEIVACARGDSTACTRTPITVYVERTQWMAPGTAPATARPSLSEDGMTIIYGDRLGRLHVISATTGNDRRTLQLEAPLTIDTAISGDLAIAIDGRGVMRAFSLADGSAAWSVPLGDTKPTKPVVDVSSAVPRVLVGAGRTLFAVETSTGALRRVIDMSAEIEAAPYSDALGVIVGDANGVVLWFDADGTPQGFNTIGSGNGVKVQPIRDGDTILAAGKDHNVYRVTQTSVGPPVRLTIAPHFDPVRAGRSIVFAHGLNVTFIDGEEAIEHPVGGTITFAPIAWPNDQAVLIGIPSGMSNGVVKAISKGGDERVVSKTVGRPLPGLLLESPLRVFVPASVGALEMFELEEGFL